MNWSELQEMQEKLDKYILDKNGIEKQDLGKLLVAASVEWHEAINETKFFKYWSKSKPNNDKVIEEFVDFIHFLLSISNHYNLEVQSIRESYIGFGNVNIEKLVLEMNRSLYTIDYNLINAWDILFDTLKYFGINDEMIFNKYLEKNKINYKRQEEGY